MKTKLSYAEFKRRLIADEVALKYQPEKELTRMYAENHAMAFAKEGEQVPSELCADEKDGARGRESIATSRTSTGATHNVNLSGSSAVLLRLNTIAMMIKIVATIGGLALGAAIGTLMEKQAIGIVIGGAIGFAIGFFATVVIDWMKEMLVLQDLIARNEKK